MRVLVNCEGNYLLSACDVVSRADFLEAVFEGGRRECLAFLAERLTQVIPDTQAASQLPEPVLPTIAV